MRSAQTELSRQNLRLAKLRYGACLNTAARTSLLALTQNFKFSLELGDLLLLDGSWYVTHSGLLRLARRKGCLGIRVAPVPQFCSPEQTRWTFRATAFRSTTCKGFNGYGDADPNNVSAVVRGAEMRVAETRAVNRALRKAYGIGTCSIEELGSVDRPSPPSMAVRRAPQINNAGEHPLRDRLLLLVRQHGLDTRQVKLYAAEFCGVDEIRKADRERMRQFVEHLADAAASDSDALRKKLEAYEITEAGAA